MTGPCSRCGRPTAWEDPLCSRCEDELDARAERIEWISVCCGEPATHDAAEDPHGVCPSCGEWAEFDEYDRGETGRAQGPDPDRAHDEGVSAHDTGWRPRNMAY